MSTTEEKEGRRKERRGQGKKAVKLLGWDTPELPLLFFLVFFPPHGPVIFWIEEGGHGWVLFVLFWRYFLLSSWFNVLRALVSHFWHSHAGMDAVSVPLECRSSVHCLGPGSRHDILLSVESIDSPPSAGCRNSWSLLLQTSVIHNWGRENGRERRKGEVVAGRRRRRRRL